MRRIVILLLAAAMTVACAACASGSKVEHTEAEEAAQPTMSAQEVDALYTQVIHGPELIPRSKPDEPICTDYTAYGLLRICYTGEDGVKYKLQVKCGDQKIVYNLTADGSVEDFSLQFGDGQYAANIMQNYEGDKYFAAETKTFNVTLGNEHAPSLTSIQNIDWNYDKLPIEDTRYIVGDALTAEQQELLSSCAKKVYTYVAEHIKYDDDKIFGLEYNYLPDIEQTYIDEKGICYDYASLMASMLRSMGIPAKLVKGYASYNPDTYHAWNEVYLDGEWIILDVTRDASLYGTANPKSTRQSPDDYTKVYEY